MTSTTLMQTARTSTATNDERAKWVEVIYPETADGGVTWAEVKPSFERSQEQERLLALSKRNPPPPEWFEEEEMPF